MTMYDLSEATIRKAIREEAEGRIAELEAEAERLREGRVYDIAAAFLAQEEIDEDESDAEAESTRRAWFKHWRKHLPTFANRNHDGDCIGIPMGCSRCLHDKWVGYARAALGEGGE